MLSIENEYNYKPEMPKNIVKRIICSKSGLIAKKECKHRITEYFIKGTEPVKTCSVHYSVPFFKKSRRVAFKITPSMKKIRLPGIEWKTVLFLPSIYNDWLQSKGLSLPGARAILYLKKINNKIGKSVVNFKILFPDNGDIFAIDPILRLKYQVLTFRAKIDYPVKEIQWFINRKKIVSKKYPYDIKWTLKKGKYYLYAVANLINKKKIRSRLISFTVK